VRAQTLYDLLAPAYGRVLDSVLELATTRAVERVLREELVEGWIAIRVLTLVRAVGL
jgi:hypothetical protein